MPLRQNQPVTPNNLSKSPFNRKLHSRGSADTGAALGLVANAAIKPQKAVTIKEQHQQDENESSSGSQSWSHHSEDKEDNHFLAKDQLRKIFVAKNHLKLNAFINVFLFACLGFVFFLDWFCLPGTGVSLDLIMFNLLFEETKWLQI